MDESTDTDSSDSDSDSNINNTNVKRGKRSGPSILNEGIIAGQRIAKISVITLISIGIAELIVGYMNGSVVATADGIDSVSYAMISFIVLLGFVSPNVLQTKSFILDITRLKPLQRCLQLLE